MTTLNPSPAQVRDAMLSHGVPLRLYRGWDTIGRAWAGPDGSPGLSGVIVHHTATASATGSTGCPSLEWCATAYSKPAANWCIGRDGASYLLSAGSCFHSGDGGPWPAIGLSSAGNRAHYRLAGIEIDDPGRSNTITPAQIDAVGRILAAYRDLCGWGPERIITHGDWTDAGSWLTDPAGNPSPPGPYKGRKNDTLRTFYPASFWRSEAAKHAGGGNVPPPPDPDRKRATDMLIIKVGSSAFRLITGDRMVGISADAASNMIAAGIPWCALPKADADKLSAELVAE